MAMVDLALAGVVVVDGKHSVKSQESFVACREMPKHFPSARSYTDDTSSHRLPGAQLWVVSSCNWSVFLGRPYHGTPREGSSSLSNQPVGYTQWCSMDALSKQLLVFDI